MYKPRIKPLELMQFEALHGRKECTKQEKRRYHNQQKGYEGELQFDQWLKGLTCDCLVLSDLLFNVNHSLVQVDSLIIMPDCVHLYEVKNYEGEYFFDHDRFFQRMRYEPHQEKSNPLTQLERTESHLRQLSQQLGFSLPLHSRVVFVNPEFTLFQAPLNKPILLPSQLQRYFHHMNRMNAQLTAKHYTLAKKLSSLHMEKNPFQSRPDVHYDHLRKGIRCQKCRYLHSIQVNRKYCLCKKCGWEELVEHAILRNIREFQLLFPHDPLTTNTIHHWCHIVESKRTIRNVLNKHFEKVGVRQWTYYQ
ncbi:NERD domain-containing protein [Gracilibacillus halophilus YIM-C55.5]|uniref:NERD domain-containing protein n=1 Tax=Gracilibacillus halophilus YIM-C55.5 TaxID=1308866 RepID=N4W7V9_9BACI|nr:nuclease-related domain-containing protein [Gracilibacillus halophilus]ENH96358.1 NERD domain-containing protein [Gracilibacillus halophilus YIM-C55.5]